MVLEDAETALIGFAGGDETVLGLSRRHDAGDAGPARMQPLVPGAVLDKFLARHRGAAGDALRGCELRRVEPEQLAGDQGGGEMSDHACRVIPAVMEPEIGRLADPDRHFHAGDIGR